MENYFNIIYVRTGWSIKEYHYIDKNDLETYSETNRLISFHVAELRYMNYLTSVTVFNFRDLKQWQPLPSLRYLSSYRNKIS